MKGFVRTALPAGALEAWRNWRRSQSLSPLARAALAADRKALAEYDMGARTAVEAAIAWLERAQDCSASRDGGVARDFSLINGWSASYPETTGYIIATMIEAARFTGNANLLTRARRMLDWLVSIQLPGGGFPGGRIDEKPIQPVTFNTGQILIGLAFGAREFGEPRYLTAMHAAARFLRDSQDPDGAWRRNPSPFALPGDKTYETHVAWGLFEAARQAPLEGYGEAGSRQVQWALGRQNDNGWFRDNCLNDPEAPLTHTIGYALRGVIEAYRFSGDEHFRHAALKTAHALAACIDASGRIAARLDANWRPAARYACLTGIVQIAACWFLLAHLAGEDEFAVLARRANCFVRRTVKMGGDPNTSGGVKGSYPIDGAYGPFQYLNWAAKFFIDANLLELAR